MIRASRAMSNVSTGFNQMEPVRVGVILLKDFGMRWHSAACRCYKIRPFPQNGCLAQLALGPSEQIAGDGSILPIEPLADSFRMTLVLFRT